MRWGRWRGARALRARSGRPPHGPLPATESYPGLFADTDRPVLTPLGTATAADGAALVTSWFRFEWTLASGTGTAFDVVDLAQLDDAGRIMELRIGYDTVDVRPAQEATTGRPSYRAP